MGDAAGSGIGYTIREAGEEDIDAIVAVVNAAYAVERFFINTDRTYRDEIARYRDDGTFLVAETEAGEIHGAVFLRHEGEEGYFGMLSVVPEMQGAGLGRLLVGCVEEVFGVMGCERVRIVVPNVRTELFPWYGALGYAERDTLPFPEPEKLTQPALMIEMAKDIRGSGG